MIYKYLAVAAVISLLVYFVYDKGRDDQKADCARRAATQAEINLEIERQQNEIENHPVTDNAFLDRLRAGRFGR